MDNNEQKVMQFSWDEYMKIIEFAKQFLENGISENPPKFVIFIGGVGSGKTTIRRQKFANGYVNFEFGEIYNATEKEFGEDNARLSDYAALASDMILKESIEGKKNIVVEIIGENKEVIDPVVNKMKDIGYDISIQAIYCDPVEAYERHIKAVKEDKKYLSAHFTQEATLSFFYNQLNLGKMPRATKS